MSYPQMDVVEALTRALEFAETGNKRDATICLNSVTTHGLQPPVGHLVHAAKDLILAAAKHGGDDRAADVARQDIAKVRQAIRASGRQAD